MVYASISFSSIPGLYEEIVDVFTKVKMHHVPREENPLADALATLAALIKV